MSKRVRSLSMDQARSLSSLEEELASLKADVETPDRPINPIRGESVVYRMMREIDPAYGAPDPTSQSVTAAGRVKAQAARRQVVVDTLRSCIVNQYVPVSGHDEALMDFVSDLDGKFTGIASTVRSSGNNLIFSRREEKDSEPAPFEIDLSLDSYIDAFSAEDMYSNIPVKDDGSFDTSSLKYIIKSVPWFDEFTEVVTLNKVLSLARLRRKIHQDFVKLKQFYTRSSYRCHDIYTHHWDQIASERLALLNRNFPRGILGFRALLNPQDPRNLRALLVKPGDLSHILVSTKRRTDAEEKEIEKEVLSELGPKASKYATLPDLSASWSHLPRPRWINRNRIIANMCEMENANMDEMAPWSLGEIRTFLERIAVHGKNFKRISSVLTDKSEKDCVDLYYRFKIHLSMKQIIAAGLQSRQDRRNSANPNGTNYRVLIEDVMAELEEILGSQWLSSHKQLETLTIRKIAQVTGIPPKIYGQLAEGDESPKRERRNALIDVLTNVISRGHSVPPQLSLFVDTSAYSTPVSSPPLTVSAPKPRLSMVQTDVALLLPSRTESPLEPSHRQLQPHNTI